MTLRTRVETRGFVLAEGEAVRIRRRLDRLARRLAPESDAVATLVLTRRGAPRRIEADLHLRLGPLEPLLVGRGSATGPFTTAREATEAVERQLTPRRAGQPGEPPASVPSRRADPAPPDD